MADTTVSAANRVKQWSLRHHVEYVRSQRFKRYSGSTQNSIIQMVEDLTKSKGDTITIPLVGALDVSAGPNDGSSLLVGNEKALPNDGHAISIGVVRDATVVNVEEEQASPIDILNAGKVALKDMQMRYLRNAIIDAMGSIAGVSYGSATEGNKDAWLATNADRVLFGSAIANNASNDHSAALLTVDAANDKLSKATVSTMKRMAQEAVNDNGDGIRPFKYGEDEETFVLFANSRAFRDLKDDMAGEHASSRERAKENPLFTGTTSLYWDGVVIREIPEIPVIGAVGAASAEVSPVYLCGSQAVGVAWAQRTKNTILKEDDYGFRKGVGFMELRGVDKILYGSGTAGKQWGMVTGYMATAADG